MNDERRSQVDPRTVWTIGLNLIALAIVALIVYQTRQVLTWVLVAVFLALSLHPLVAWLIRHRFRKWLAVALVMLTLLAVSVGLFATIVPVLVTQGQKLVDDAPRLIETLRTHPAFRWADDKFDVIDSAQQELADNAATAAGGIFRIVGGIFTGVVATITVLALTVYMLIYGNRVVDGVFEWIKPSKRPRWVTLARRAHKAVAGYVTGSLIIAAIGGVVTGTALAILGVPYFLPLGVAMMLLGLVPYVGSTIGAVLVVGTTFLTSGTTTGVIALVIFVGYQQLENEVLQPMIQRRTIKMSPLLIAIVMLVGTALAGVLGALLALPVAGAIQVVIEDVFERRKARWEARGDGAAPGQ